jgi:hypothetical protein
MTLGRWLPALAIVVVTDVAGMLLAAATGRMHLVLALAALFCLVMIGAALVVNAPYWRPGGRAIPPLLGLGMNTRLMALTYFWGALAMQGLYTTRLTGMRWQHGWQYALVMLILAWGALTFASGLETRDIQRRNLFGSVAIPLAVVQGIGAATGVLFLVASGKLANVRADWGANQVFLFGALTIMVLAAVALRTHTCLARN